MMNRSPKPSSVSPVFNSWRVCVFGFTFSISLACLVGCTSQEPATTTSLKTLRLGDAADLQRIMRADEETNLVYKLQFARDQGPIYFGELNTYDDNDGPMTSAPIIAQKVGQKWRAIRIDDSRLKNAAWVQVAAGPGRGEIWGVLDQSVGESDELQSDILVAHSTDAGETFSLTALRKPDAAAAFDSLCVARDGRGRLTVYLAAGDTSDRVRAGYYSFTTADKGRSWSRGRFEPDALVTATTVSDDEQPDVQSPIQTAASFPHK
jgi:hypothetical protein